MEEIIGMLMGMMGSGGSGGGSGGGGGGFGSGSFGGQGSVSQGNDGSQYGGQYAKYAPQSLPTADFSSLTNGTATSAPQQMMSFATPPPPQGLQAAQAQQGQDLTTQQTVSRANKGIGGLDFSKLLAMFS